MSLFTKVISKVPKLNAFDLSFENLLSSEFGQIVPVSCKEVLPGDVFRQSTEAVVKTAPMLAPIYSRIDLYLHYFFVPLRLLQSDFEDFITTGVDGLSTDMTPPYATLNDLYLCQPGSIYGVGPFDSRVEDGSLKDYLNIPKISGSEIDSAGIQSLPVNLFPFMAYQKIYSDWYRDELLDSYEFKPFMGGQIGIMTSSSDYETSLNSLITMRYRSWKKDYFTSARPSTQLGAPVVIPGAGEIVANGNFRLGTNSSSIASNRALGFYYNVEDLGEDKDPRYVSDTYISSGSDPFQVSAASVKYGDGLEIDNLGISVNDLRRALKLQEWQEKNMRGGNRYIENIFHHFGVKSSDARLQRSELLGGRKIPVVIQEVTQTSATSSQPTALGQLAGKGQAVAKTHSIKWRAEEHGLIMCLASIMPKTGYMQGLERMYWRMSYLDYAWPLFGNLGEQEVYNGEIYLAQSTAKDPFGYQSRYADMKFSSNQIHGSFRSSQNYWHNTRIFSSAPQLNNNFVRLAGSEITSQNRIFPTLTSGYGHFYLHIYHDIKVLRALPKYGIPSI